MKTFRAVAAAVLLSVSFVLVAHEGHVHKVMGTVAAVHASPDSIDVKTTDGKAVAVLVDYKTRVLKGSAAATFQDVKVGSRVVVSVVEQGGKLTASEVRLPPAEAPRKSPASPR